jgi:hypothetical protein
MSSNLLLPLPDRSNLTLSLLTATRAGQNQLAHPSCLIVVAIVGYSVSTDLKFSLKMMNGFVKKLKDGQVHLRNVVW